MNEEINNGDGDAAEAPAPVRAVVVSGPRSAESVNDVPCVHAELVSERRDGLTATLQRWADNRLFVVGVLLVVGPLGLPLIWVSRRLSLGAKIAWTVVFVLFTVVLPIALVWYCCDVLLQPLLDAFEQQRSL